MLLIFKGKILNKSLSLGNGVDHATAFGRIAFSIPTPDLPPLEARIKAASLGTVKTPLVVLPTPGKADVQVVILEDPVSCFVFVLESVSCHTV